MTSYPAVTYKALRDAIVRRRGLVPGSMSTADLETVAGYAAARLKEGWTWGAWPGWCPVERVPVVPEWTAGTQYAGGALVWYAPDGLYYATASATTAEPGNAPWVQAPAPITRDMDMVFDVYLSDPRDNARARRTPWLMGVSGVTMPKVAAGSSVWVHYRLSPPQLTATAWNKDTAYAPGDLVYDEATGDCWVCLVGGTDKPPSTNLTLWSRQVVPKVLEDAIVSGAAGDWLESSGQSDQAGRLQGRSRSELVEAYGKALGQSNALEI